MAFVSIAFFCASAFSAMKLLGADAAIHCSTAKRRRAFVLASVCAASTMPSSVRALSRYIAAVYAENASEMTTVETMPLPR